MDPSQSFNQPPGASNSSEKSAAPPAYQHNPNQPVPQGPYTQGPYPGQAVVTVQPAVFVTAAPLANPVPDYLGYSIFTMLCCCLPLGIAALIYSISTRDANFSGQRELAEKNSKTALILNHIGLGIGLVVIVLFTIIQIVILTAR
ncbi:synapse differentiation-inducing gene protein 1-like [Sinocyclocheilus grahami]|uniref:synapse differentiation-inducing gene protein 1-like n=1 Tax=Sinocyclocheilus grahami TaxID=75366 RepID=UPI0007AC6F4A|nr:PREDICTED: synapse differentiation-inducing gene protein 1-like [Sinocyclocheilus grahami]